MNLFESMNCFHYYLCRRLGGGREIYMNADVKTAILYIMEHHMDTIMEKHGFKRRGNSLNYIRVIGTTRQKIEMSCYSHPSYYPGTLAHIYPFYYVLYPEINKVAQNLISDMDLALKNIGNWNKTFNQPIQFAYSGTEQWVLLTNEKSEADVIAKKIIIFLEQHIIPFLDELKTIDGYIDTYLQRDERIRKDDDFYFFIACAYAIRQEYAKGLEVLEQRFRTPSSREIYRKAFEFLESKNSNNL